MRSSRRAGHPPGSSSTSGSRSVTGSRRCCSASPTRCPGRTTGPVADVAPAAEAFAFYAAQCARSDEIVAGLALDVPPVGRHPGPLGDETTDLRRIILHMIEETARHAGHLDVVRELLDGTTGLGPR